MIKLSNKKQVENVLKPMINMLIFFKKTPVCASSPWQTCKVWVALGLGRAGFMTKMPSLLCTILLLPAFCLPEGPFMPAVSLSCLLALPVL